MITAEGLIRGVLSALWLISLMLQVRNSND